jgi:hypothetical protein
MYVIQAYKNQLGQKAIICQITGRPENFAISIGISTKNNKYQHATNT